jgi:Ca2+-binding RTX toxin-like protein
MRYAFYILSSADTLISTSGNNMMNGQGGNDAMNGRSGNDQICLLLG